MNESIVIENLKLRFNNEKLLFNNLGLDIKKNSFNVLLGPTGGGKTTLFRIIKGIIPYLNPIKIDGKIFVNNELKTDETYFKQSTEIGYLFQDFDLQFIGSSVENELAFQLENMGIPSDEIKKRINWFVNEFSLNSILKTPPNNLSGGELAKVEFISSIITSPSIILLDEPFVNLDYIARSSALRILSQFKGQYTILVSSHDFIPFIDLIDNIFVINERKIIYYSDIKSFFYDVKKFNWVNITDLAIQYYLKKMEAS